MTEPASLYTGGGGAYGSTLHNCTLTGNAAQRSGGGAAGEFEKVCTLNNCVVYFSSAPEVNYDSYSILNYCCTTPSPTNGVGNITNSPLFVDEAGGNLRLQSNSPCTNSGLNAYAPVGSELDGNPRIMAGTVDIGAYEFESATSIISYDWLQQYGLVTDGSADYSNSDSDLLNNWQEWIAGTVIRASIA